MREPNDHLGHVWRFFRSGGCDQVRLDRGSDIAAIGMLDQKLWVALACPTHGIEFDERTLDLIDTDKNGRIRAPELIAAANWTAGLIKNVDDLMKGNGTLPLAAIDDSGPEGRSILASARTILRVLGKADASEIALQDAIDSGRISAATAFNGDGIVPVDAAEDEETKAALATVIDCIGAEIDRGGKPGVSQATADRFFTDATAELAWRGEATAAAATILPLGDGTAAGAAAVAEMAEKLDDYFTRCQVAACDPRAIEPLNVPLAGYEALAAQLIGADNQALAAMPVARIEPDRPLPLGEGINPAWSAAIDRLRQAAIIPLLGARGSLSEADWQTVKARFAIYHAWLARKPVTALEKLDDDRIRQFVQSGVRQRIDALIVRDKALEAEMNAISEVEKLIRYQRDLANLLNNFVAFRDFYSTRKAPFQAGTLYLDGRSCALCVKVEDEATHAPLAALARIYLVYCRCTKRGAAEQMTIAAAFTDGSSDNLRIGRNGLFYDRKGGDWDATIVKIVEHPISLRQAFWLPYRQAARMVREQIDKLAAARTAAAQTRMATTAMQTGITGAPPPAATPPNQAFDAARFAGIFAAIGLAIGAIGTAIASLVTGFLLLSWWQMPLAIAGIILVVSGPSMVIAALKIHSRNLGPVLDACGWAINARLRINHSFGSALTGLARLPPDAKRSLSDPYAEKKGPWGLVFGLAVIALVIVVLWKAGAFKRLFGG